MEVLGSFGEIRDLFFIDNDTLISICGNIATIFHLQRGVKSTITRPYGILSFDFSRKDQLLAIAPEIGSKDIEIVDINNQIAKWSIGSIDFRVISMSFSPDSSKLLCLSESENQEIFLWDISKQAFLFKINTPYVCNSCLFDKTEESYFCLFGEKAVSLGSIKQIIQQKEAQIVPLDKSICSDIDLSMVSFLCFLPLSYALFCNQESVLFAVNLKNNQIFSLGNIYHPVDSQKMCHPSSVALTVNHVLVGTSGGILLWFDYDLGFILNSHSSDLNMTQIFSFEKCAQFMEFGSGIMSIMLSPSSDTLLLSCKNCRMFSVPSAVREIEAVPLDESISEGIPPPPPPPLPFTKLMTLQRGAVLYSASFSLTMIKSDSSTSDVPVMMTLSHENVITIWKVPSPGFHVPTGSTASGNNQSNVFMSPLLTLPADVWKDNVTITSIFVQYNRRDPWIFIGTSDGYLEVYVPFLRELEEDVVPSGAHTPGAEAGAAIAADRGALSNSLMSQLKTSPTSTFEIIEDDGVLFQPEWKRLTSSRFSREPICLLSTDFQGSRLFLGSKDNRIFLIDLVFDPYDILARGSILLPTTPISCSWDRMSTALLVFGENGDVYHCKLDDFEVDDVDVSYHFHSLPSPVVSSQSNIYGTMFILTTLSHNLIITNNGFEGDKVRFVEHFSHSDQISCFCVSSSFKYVVTGSVDGQVYLWKVDSDITKSVLLGKQRVHQDPIVSLCFSADSLSVFAFATDGAAINLSILKASPFDSLDPNYSMVEYNQSDYSGVHSMEELTWFEKFSQKKIEKLKENYRLKASDVEAVIDDICSRTKSLIQQNGMRESCEQLSREDFVINTQLVATRREEMAKLVHNLKIEYSNRNDYNELLASRMKVLCYDGLEVCNSRLYNIGNEDTQNFRSISSFSVLKYSAKDQKWLDRMKRLRALEIMYQNQSKPANSKGLCNNWSCNTQGIPLQEMDYMLLCGYRQPTAENPLITSEILATMVGDSNNTGGPATGNVANNAVNGGAGKKEKEVEDDEESLGSEGSSQEIDSRNLFQLFYEVTSVRTTMQKINHLWFLRDLDHHIRGHFNKIFDKLLNDREDTIGQITSRNNRISEIMAELSISESIWTPKYLKAVKASNSFIVNASEVQSQPYENAAAREQRFREEEIRRKRDEESSKNDVKGRALQDMMFGTLEVKKNLLGNEAVLKKPEWMDTIPLNQMSESQIKEMEAFEEKLKQIQDEQMNYRKALEQEMKKLRTEIVEVTKAFDDKFQDVFDKRLRFSTGLLSQELYMSQLALSLVKKNYLYRSLISLRQSIELVKQQRSEVKKKLHTLQSSIDEIRQEMMNVLEEEKNLDKSFKKDIQLACNMTFDQETLKILYSLYRIRHFPHSDMGDQSLMEHDTGMASRTASDAMQSRQGRAASNTTGGAKKTLVSRASQSNARLKESRSRVSKSQSASGAGGDSAAGPMQEAAKALRNDGGPNGGVNGGNGSGNNWAFFNPYDMAQNLLKKLAEQMSHALPQKTPLDKDSDCPEGFNIDQFSWSKLQELRMQRIEKEIRSKQLSIQINELKSQYDRVNSEDAKFEKTLAQYRSTRDSYVREASELESDIYVVVALKQGQDEVGQDAAAADYSSSLLLPKSVITSFNTRIKELGKEKIGILNKTKMFRRKINSIEWEASHLEMLTHHYEEYFTDLQLLRVTKDLQQILREGSHSDSSKVSNFQAL